LLLAKLDAIFRNLLTTVLTVLSGWIASLLERTFFRIAFGAFEKELLLFPATQFAAGINVPSHSSPE
jgi:hypothetical protein